MAQCAPGAQLPSFGSEAGDGEDAADALPSVSFRRSEVNALRSSLRSFSGALIATRNLLACIVPPYARACTAPDIAATAEEEIPEQLQGEPPAGEPVELCAEVLSAIAVENTRALRPEAPAPAVDSADGPPQPQPRDAAQTSPRPAAGLARAAAAPAVTAAPPARLPTPLVPELVQRLVRLPATQRQYLLQILDKLEHGEPDAVPSEVWSSMSKVARSARASHSNGCWAHTRPPLPDRIST